MLYSLQANQGVAPINKMTNGLTYCQPVCLERDYIYFLERKEIEINKFI